MSQKTEDIVRRWFKEVWNEKRFETMDELMTADAIAHGFPPQGTPANAAAFKQAVKNFHETFSNIRVSIEDLLVDGDRAAVRWRAFITHTGEGLGCAPTGETVSVTGISIVRLEDGKIAEGWDAFDLTRHVVALRRIAESREVLAQQAAAN